ncbi:translation factor Guf1, mitochondrial-like isoform X1 [Octopus vulgaris]|uniref:Translation factor GUF1 homolog, mitochondrial n=1 Tax=Octopus vulgaris TaxID=6645 RepID=A0AA36B1K8_OCTVU|nr:translation factor Guf1, mitochondrial-like isoform X1 [Octopus vulgaris]
MNLCKHLTKTQKLNFKKLLSLLKRSSFRSCVLHQNYSSSSPKVDLSKFPVEYIRNFSIIAHVDHGKSTLSDRLLEFTGTIPTTKDNKQVLDKLQIERERGITVKAQTVSLVHTYKGKQYLLNLIDTPGHVDFQYEVSRSMSACQGVLLLVDANHGVQAQTVANYYLASELKKTIIPVLNKIDLKVARPEEVLKQLKSIFDIEPSTTLKVSAKLGTGILELLETIIERIPPPPSDRNAALKAITFDSWFNHFRGVIVSLTLLDGVLTKRDKVMSAATGKLYEVQEIGFMYPEQVPCEKLYAGQVGYMIANIRDIKEARIGDTIFHPKTPVTPVEGFKPAKAMVFAGVFPADQSEYDDLRKAIEKLTLNDSSVSVNIDTSPVLGQGWRLGFLGLLHMDVFSQRLEQEYDMSSITTVPNVLYKVKIHGSKNIKHYQSDVVDVLNPCQLPDPNIITEYLEPVVLGTIITPLEYIGDIMNLSMDRRGVLKNQINIDDNRVMITMVFPLNEILVDFFDDLKSMTSGYASFDYEDYGYQPSSLVKLVFSLNSKPVDELTMICHVSKARQLAKKTCVKLHTAIPRQLYHVIIQASISGKIIAREDIKPYKKDVLSKCYGGDVTRKMKLLRHQAEGKKKLRRIGNVDVPRDAFIKILQK